MDMIRVLIAEDHTIVRKGIRSLLEKEPDIEVVAEAENGREAITKSGEIGPDVVVMDIGMPILNGIEASRQLKKNYPKIEIIILTMHSSEEYVLQALRSGASGYLVKKAAPSDLVTAIHEVHKGRSYLSASVSKTLIKEYLRQTGTISENEKIDRETELTSRQTEVLQLLAEGYTNRETANILSVSIKTIETHRTQIKKRLNIQKTAGLVQYALQKGLIIKE
ncbi:MAG: response regulator transcription factor [Proteobacteria bacterium]|nr:response regulator transcription factor [Pseudomonadota bacterium]MBU1585180.1 response regulator transcription factor [Pseudomonadota bacterium]MBU2454493.1 response regulator transcription factor [Pseudomonadota bacterium]MBU2629070.1 response regulator transcription factor [Pseudomonadota bacterium]